MKTAKRVKVAGEVRFIKDNTGDESQWAYANHGPSEREIVKDYAFSPRNVKPLAKTLRSTTAALGHCMSGYTVFTKIKSSTVSPDGNLGGKGYIQKISDMRKQFMNCVEALSALSDTLYDEVRAPHWTAISRQEDPQDRKEVEEIIQDAEEIREDPEGWAKEEEAEMDREHDDE
jgi:hypothetical protein